MIQKNLFTKQKQKLAGVENKLMIIKGKGLVGIHLEFGISSYRLLYMK